MNYFDVNDVTNQVLGFLKDKGDSVSMLLGISLIVYFTLNKLSNIIAIIVIVYLYSLWYNKKNSDGIVPPAGEPINVNDLLTKGMGSIDHRTTTEPFVSAASGLDRDDPHMYFVGEKQIESYPTEYAFINQTFASQGNPIAQDNIIFPYKLVDDMDPKINLVMQGHQMPLKYETQTMELPRETMFPFQKHLSSPEYCPSSYTSDQGCVSWWARDRPPRRRGDALNPRR